MLPSNFLESNCPILVAFSGGKDSVAMVLHLLELGIDRQRIHLHHHDVDGGEAKLFDWSCTESYCKAFAKQFDLKLFFSYRKGGIMREIMRTEEAKQDVYFQTEVDGPFHIAESKKNFISTRRKFPAVNANLLTRWCSATVKIDVLRTAVCNNPAYLGDLFILTGERREESPNRAKYDPIEVHKVNSKSRKTIGIRLILDWSEQDVWAIMKRWNVQPHPAYMLGWSRCSCQLCIFSHSNIWATISVISPEKVAKIEETENTINHTLYNKQNIRQKIASGRAFLTMDPYWVAQATGTFTAPILTSEWNLPAGAYRKETAGSV